MRLSSILSCSLVLSLTTLAHAKSAMRCFDLGAFFGDCALNERSLYHETRTERDFSVRFRYFCPGHGLKIGFKTERAFHRIDSMRETQELLVTGRSLSLHDDDPNGTVRSSFDSNCELEVLESSMQLSKASKDTLASMEEEALLSADTIKALHQSAAALLSASSNLQAFWGQREQMLSILKSIDPGWLPGPVRVMFRYNLNILRKMAEGETHSDQFASVIEKLITPALKAVQEQLTTLLDRRSELKLRAIEILSDAGLVDSPDWKDLLSKLS